MMDSKDQKIMELESEIKELERFTGFQKTYYSNFPYKSKGMDGYWYIYRKTTSGFMHKTSEHRYIMQQSLPGQIPKGYIVHHRDGNKCNNTLSNLDILTRSEHSKKHNSKHKLQ